MRLDAFPFFAFQYRKAWREAGSYQAPVGSELTRCPAMGRLDQEDFWNDIEVEVIVCQSEPQIPVLHHPEHRVEPTQGKKVPAMD